LYNNFQLNLFAQQQQQQQNQWHFNVQNHQQVQMANSIGNSGPLKRQVNGTEESEEKENSWPNKRPRGGDEADEGQHEPAAAEEEEEADEEVDEEEEEKGDTSRSTK
jgi:hypothetical protein